MLYGRVHELACTLYSSSYRKQSESLDILEDLHSQISRNFEYLTERGVQFFYESFSASAQEVLPFLQLLLGDESPDWRKALPEIRGLVYHVFRLGVDARVARPNTTYANLLAGFFKYLRDQLVQRRGQLSALAVVLQLAGEVFRALYDRVGAGGEWPGLVQLAREATPELLRGLAELRALYGSDREFRNSGFKYQVYLVSFGLAAGLELPEELEYVWSEKYSLVESCNIREIQDCFVLFRNAVNAYLLAHLRGAEGDAALIEEYHRLFRFCLEQLSCMKYTFHTVVQYCQIQPLYEVIFDERIVRSRHVLESQVLDRIVIESLKMDKGFMFSAQRKAVDKLFEILHADMRRVQYFERSVLKIVRYQEYRGFDSGLRFYDEEVQVPELREAKSQIPPRAQYFGAYPRFVFLKLFQK